VEYPKQASAIPASAQKPTVAEVLARKRHNSFIFIRTILDHELNPTIISIFSIKATTKLVSDEAPDKLFPFPEGAGESRSVRERDQEDIGH